MKFILEKQQVNIVLEMQNEKNHSDTSQQKKIWAETRPPKWSRI